MSGSPRCCPYLLFGPLAGAVADRLDRRLNLIDRRRGPRGPVPVHPAEPVFGFANQLTWIYVAQFLACCASLFWTPAKDASIPNLVPPDKLEQANQYSLLTTYGTAPIASLLFVVLAAISSGLAESRLSYFGNPATGQVNLALYFNVVTFVISALTIYLLRELPRGRTASRSRSPSVAKSIWEGWRFVGKNRVVRGIVDRHDRRVRRRPAWSSASATSTSRAR